MNLTRVPSFAAVFLVCGPLLAQVPSLEVDASWPQPLPSKWSIGPISSVAVGPNDHVWIVQRPAAIKPDEKNGTTPAPPVIEYDTQGKVVQAWGGPGAGYDWPLNEHGIFVDYKGNVWIAGVGGKDWGRILKFTSAGKFLLQIGRPLPAGETFTNNNSTVLGRQPADVDVDPKTNELYVADGDGGAQRVAKNRKTVPRRSTIRTVRPQNSSRKPCTACASRRMAWFMPVTGMETAYRLSARTASS